MSVVLSREKTLRPEGQHPPVCRGGGAGPDDLREGVAGGSGVVVGNHVLREMGSELCDSTETTCTITNIVGTFIFRVLISFSYLR